VGKKAFGTGLINAYIAKVHRVTHHVVVGCDVFLRVLNLSAPTVTLFKPAVLMRVLGKSTRVDRAVTSSLNTAA